MKPSRAGARAREPRRAAGRRDAPQGGIDYWLVRVLKQLKAARRKFAAEPVHQLRVAFRQCRSMADAYVEIDPDGEWEGLKKSAKKIFQGLGALRDVQVAEGWVKKLAPADSSLARALLKELAAQKKAHKERARAAHRAFDRKSWKEWRRRLPDRVREFRPGNAAFQQVALKRWSKLLDLHERVLRSPQSRAAWHRLRIGIKRFRYVVENFLPGLFGRWATDLKRLQELLGEVHDLDVLWDRIAALGSKHEKERRSYWRPRIEKERRERTSEYLARMNRKPALWQEWRKVLPATATDPAHAT